LLEGGDREPLRSRRGGACDSFWAMNADAEARIRQSFARQTYMGTLGAELVHVDEDEVDITLPFSEKLVQQDGFLHAGVVAGITDSACGYAALTRLDASVEVLTVEFKINLLAPAAGERLIARGRVVRSGRSLTVCRGDAVTLSEGREKHVATMTATLIAVRRLGTA
jgi:uncharacterized protein (TIGR00369 family)